METEKLFEYSNRIIAFIDILGFTNYILESDSDAEKARRVFELVTDLKEKIKGDYESDDRIVCKYENEIMAVSDSIIISHPFYHEYPDDSFLMLAMDVFKYQEFLINKGWICRGAIAMGNVHHTSNEIFGKAYLEAFHLESKNAIYPRVILSKEVASQFKESQFFALTLMDKDGYYFLDYLKMFIIHESGDETITKLKGIIEFSLKNETNNSIIEKYLWLKDYYNYALVNYNFYGKLDVSSRFAKISSADKVCSSIHRSEQ